jgi:hypothetical protein
MNMSITNEPGGTAADAVFLTEYVTDADPPIGIWFGVITRSCGDRSQYNGSFDGTPSGEHAGDDGCSRFHAVPVDAQPYRFWNVWPAHALIPWVHTVLFVVVMTTRDHVYPHASAGGHHGK